MNRTVEKVAFPIQHKPQVLRVAAYARVSSGKDAMLHSLSAQVSYYSDLIQRTPGWLYCGVYADEALTGTKEAREQFQRLLSDCRMGNIDLILTKSVSRFSRNTLTTLETIRELKALGVDVFFEEQNIHTLSGEGELMLTILASFAQEESLSASENQKWRVQRAFEQGELINFRFMFGYRVSRGEVKVEPTEAEIVCEVFRRAIAGESLNSLAKELNGRGVETVLGGAWTPVCIRNMLQNEKYTGNALLMKRFRNNHLEKKEVPNRGEKQQYYAEGTHEAIIDMETFAQAQTVLRRFTEQTALRAKPTRNPFSGRITCGYCGSHYMRRSNHAVHFWDCSTYIKKGSGCCHSGRIREETLYEIAQELLGSADCPELLGITAKDHVLSFVLRDGTELSREYRLPSRSDSWSEEMRKAAAEKIENRVLQSKKN